MTPDDPVMQGRVCPYCGCLSEYVDSAKIYGRSYGMIYACFKCDAWVGVHRGTDIAKGRLANRNLRQWKIKAHEAFDRIWKSKKLQRSNAYYWLSIKMGLPREMTHIGMFNEEQCKQVIKICKSILK